ncbi:MAG TPA: hypothetical protein VKU60_05535, partial [Chloroflexota bacterium]|nr:hypothetical protein [Chloroflexota bacterium]
VLVVNDAQQLGLSGGEGNLYKGTVHIDNDGQYHVAALDQGQQVRLSEDFFIEAHKASAPTVRVAKPGPDYHASPIEEVGVSVSADAEFGINDMALHYSVNGGPEQTINLLKQKGAKQADAATTLSLEDFKMVPGDVVSLYATAKDARADARTDMMFIQADPFEKEYSQSQAGGGAGAGGGGGGGGGNQNEISQREKEIIAQTWKQQGDKSAAKQQAAEAAKFLNNVQSKLRDQALSLAGRLERRELNEENQEFSDFQKDMNAAAQSMNGAADKLKDQKWNDALPAEQKALQNLLRAEATFRQIQVAFGSRAGGGGGGGGGAARDLESLFDLELDTEKNQYETGQTADPAAKRAQDIDDALQKLDQLARRQQELAEQPQPNSPEQTQQQRYQQEMLRRQADELQRQMEQMQQNQRGSQSAQQGQSGQSQSGSQPGGQPGGQSSGGQSSGQSGSQSSASGGQPGGQSGAGGSQSQGGTGVDPRVQQALDRLRQANDDMRRATSNPQSQADARRAADRLREATNLLGSTGQQQASQQMDSMARDANRLGSDERSQAERQKQLQGQNGRNGGSGQPSASAQAQDQSKLADERQRTADELANLEKQMQDAVRAMASSQRDAASKLRDALGGLDQSDLENRLQRSAQGMRRGFDPNAEENERNIAAGMQRLEDQLRDAQQAVTNQKGSDTEQALDQVERLRNQMEALSRNLGAQNSRDGQQGGPQPGQRAGQQGQGQGQGGGNQNGNAGGPGNMANNGNNGGGLGARTGQYGGGAGPQYGGPLGFDTGGYTNSGTETKPVPVTQADMERAYQDAQRQLEQLRQQVQGQPGPLSDIQDLLRQIQQMDPSRFPGNPAMIEQLHGQVLATVDKLELQLRRELDDKQQGQVRSGDSLPVPAGYQDSVADYFRRLSKNTSNNP